MEPMNSKKNKMLSSESKRSVDDGSGGPDSVDLEIKPGGMLVQKRTDEMNPSSISIHTIKVRVKYGSSYHEIQISFQASFSTTKFQIQLLFWFFDWKETIKLFCLIEFGFRICRGIEENVGRANEVAPSGSEADIQKEREGLQKVS